MHKSMTDSIDTKITYDSVKNRFKNSVAIDFEAIPDGSIYSIGALYKDRVFKAENIKNIGTALSDLDKFAKNADFILGHNIIRHDLVIAKNIAPDAVFLKLPAIDTLFLSPLAFPENPYHRLIKDYKLLKTSKNDPVSDSRIALSVFDDQINAFLMMKEKFPRLLSFYSFAFKESLIRGYKNNFHGLYEVFDFLSEPVSSDEDALSIFEETSGNRLCRNGVKKIWPEYLNDLTKKSELAYILSWIRVSGGNSVIPPWVNKEFPGIKKTLQQLRYFCGDEDCSYCGENNNSKKILKKNFGFDDFRTLKDGRKLQQDIVDSALSGKPVLGILPTGGGKSICYQIPALHKFDRLGELSVVISPLKALMKDQVDNLNKATGSETAAAINGSLTMPERSAAIEKVRLGDTGLLYISPEQLRNKNISALLESRNIAYWVFDEAHCLSKWGHDFRPDYLYVADFIKAYSKKTDNAPLVCSYTATAKIDVVDEIKSHFMEKLNSELQVFAGGVERDNLSYQVWPVPASAKDDLIFTTLHETLSQKKGGGIVYCSSRKKTENLSTFLNQRGIVSDYFHAGRTEPEKRNIQDDYVSGKIPVICATNAFGMGIDKKDIRIVIHADIPGSLENYLQEAGRAGRDMEFSECILLYEEEDTQDQFSANSYSRLTVKDIKKILKVLRKRGKKTPDIIITPGEIKRLIGDDSKGDTKIRTGVSWLERKGFVERSFNKTLFFQGVPLVKNMAVASEKINKLNLSKNKATIFNKILLYLFNADSDSLISADDIATNIGDMNHAGDQFIDSKDIIMVLSDMSKAGLIKEGVILTAYVRPKGRGNSPGLLRYFCDVENEMIKIMEELEPLASDSTDGKNIFNLRLISQKLKQSDFENINMETVDLILRAISNDKGKNDGKSLHVKGRAGADQRVLYIKFPWSKIKKRIQIRHTLSKVILERIIFLLPEHFRHGAAEVLSSFFMADIHDAMLNDIFLLSLKGNNDDLIEKSLLYLHDLKIITMQSGLGVFRQAMTLSLTQDSKKRQYTKGDFEPLHHHYGQKNVQVHVMDAYARIGIDKIKNALKYVAEYFSFSYDLFIEKYFKDHKEIIQTALTSELYKKIIQDLQNNIQESIVAADPEKNILVFAGPGSGKTKTIVHRCAWLIKAKSVNPSSILVLCYNHNSMIELKKRIKALAGKAAANIVVMTCHGFAMRITGSSFLEKSNRFNTLETTDTFNEIISDATRILKGEKEIAGMEEDEARQILLSQYKYIFVDEYQDIDQEQYDLLSAITGRLENDKDAKISIMAVGDDDQSIYGFRDANVKYIKEYQKEYDAKTFYLVENYRSPHPVIEASNHLIAFNRERMKIDHPVRINNKRRDEIISPPDILEEDRVQLIHVDNLESMGVSLSDEIEAIKAANPYVSYNNFAVISRVGISKLPLVSARLALAKKEIPFCYSIKKSSGFPVSRIREIQILTDYLENNKTKSILPVELKKDILNLYPKTNTWVKLIETMLNSWCDINPDFEISALKAKNFIFEALLEERQTRVGQGVFLGTVHSIKGMEFKYVFILDGGWQIQKSNFEKEEERRLYYTGMTRAEKKLFLYSHSGHRPLNPHTKLLKDSPYISERNAGRTERIKGFSEDLTVSIIGMKDIFISYPGLFNSNHPIHKNINILSCGDPVAIRCINNDVFIFSQNTRVAKFSKKGADVWAGKIDTIISARILAIIKRKKNDADENSIQNLKVDQWENLIVEVLHRHQ